MVFLDYLYLAAKMVRVKKTSNKKEGAAAAKRKKGNKQKAKALNAATAAVRQIQVSCQV